MGRGGRPAAGVRSHRWRDRGDPRRASRRTAEERRATGRRERGDRSRPSCRTAEERWATASRGEGAAVGRAVRQGGAGASHGSWPRWDRLREACRSGEGRRVGCRGEKGDRREASGRTAGFGSATERGWRARGWRARGWRARGWRLAVAGPGLTRGRAKGRCFGPQARSSVVEHYLDTVGVAGSTPVAPTNSRRICRRRGP